MTTPGNPNSVSLTQILDDIKRHELPATTYVGDDGITRFVPWEQLGRKYELWHIRGQHEYPALVKALRLAIQSMDCCNRHSEALKSLAQLLREPATEDLVKAFHELCAANVRMSDEPNNS